MEQHFVFESAGAVMAVPVEVVEEIREQGRVTAVPGASPDVLGLIQHRGHMVPVIDLSRRLEPVPGTDARSGGARPGCLVVIQGIHDGVRRRCALAVDRVLGVRAAPEPGAPATTMLDLSLLFVSSRDGSPDEAFTAEGTP